MVTHKSLKLCQGQLLSTSGPQIPDIYSINTTVLTGAGCPQLKGIPEVQEPRPIDCFWESLLLRAHGRAGCLAMKIPPVNMEVKWNRVSGSHQSGASRVHKANTDSDLAMWGSVSAQARWHPSVGCTGGGFIKRTMVTVPLALALKPYNLVFPCMSLVLPKLLFLCWNPG